MVEYNPSLPKIGLIMNKARIVLLVDLRKKKSDLGSGDEKKALKMISR